MHTLTLSRATPRSGTPSRAEGRLRATLMAASLAAILAVLTTLPSDAGAVSRPEISGEVALSMLDIMVQRGLLTKEDAETIISQAKARAEARAEAETPPPLPAGAKRVAYVPEIVKRELREEIKQEVMAKARDEGWAAPNEVPEWTQRIKFSGDIRGRYEGVYYPDGNATGGTDQIDFNAINNDGPLNIPTTVTASNPFRPPFLNADQNRERARLRARLGMEADLGEGFTSGLRIATGSGSAPVSTNQTLGGSGGNFSKYQLWLDRAYIKWDAVREPDLGLTVDLGRFDNPFFSTDLIWDGDLGFDGVAVSGRYEAAKGVTPFLTAGAFPVYNTDFNLSSTDSVKSQNNNKWLYGVQAGTDWTPTRNVGVKIGAGYFHFKDIEGEKSSPCAAGRYDTNGDGSIDVDNSGISCDTDASRPGFAQKGNTYFGLRDLVTANAVNTYQYYGLATPFHELTLTGRMDYDGFAPLRLTLDGEFVKNLAFDEGKIRALAPENNNDGTSGLFDGGDTGYLMRLTLGTPGLKERWDWNTSLAYKYVESDAVVDGLTDSDFGLGGTNLKGFILGGNLALARNVSSSLTWMSADSIAGAPYSVDVVQANVQARF